MDLASVFRGLDKGILLQCLDSMQNAISIYDKDLKLLYANDSYCRNMFIEDRASVLGRNINDIMKESGVKVFAMQANKEKLALPQVLEYGKSINDWEVKLFNDDDPKKTRMMVFDMYPIFDEDGQVKGVIETSHSRHSDMRRVKKVMGFRAEYTFDDILGESEAIKSRIWQAAHFAGSKFNLHIHGESGVGKELFAQSVHNASDNRQGPFVALNCASFPENLIESELFGYVGGAFTGASKSGQMSKFELADGGTLFLDEIGDMQLQFQAKLLRVLETNTVTRIGSSTSIPFNVRIISATNLDLEKMVEEGTFRRDLYYRLQVLNLDIPPLRERERDVLLIADHFLETIAEMNGERKKVFSPEAEEEMLRYSWPGNIRELKNAMNRISVLSKGETIQLEDLQTAIYSKGHYAQQQALPQTAKPEAAPRKETREDDPHATPQERIAAKMKNVEDANIDLLREALELAGGSKGDAAELLGVSRKTMYNLLHKYHMEI